MNSQNVKFSFVIAVYNVEEYIHETIDSLLNQSIGFEENCEIIFVNDGSLDNSEAICLEYQAKFPQNIKYIKQANKGLSAARNRGIKEVRGKYTSFIDPDDKLSKDALAKVYEFFEAHYNEVDFVSIKIRMFEAREGDHTLNYKFHGSRVVRIEENFQDIQLSGASVFVKSKVLADGYKFDPKVKRFGEDIKFLVELVLNKMAYGVVDGPVYYYRKRHAANSILDGTGKSKDWYFTTPNLVLRYLMEHSKSKLGKVPRYVQYAVMYDLQWRFMQENHPELNPAELKRYIKALKQLLQEIDDEIIMSQRNIFIEHKLHILSLKHETSVVEAAHRKGTKYLFGETEVYDYSKAKQKVLLDWLSFNSTGIVLEGQMTGLLFSGAKLIIKINGKTYNVNETTRKLPQTTSLGIGIYKKFAFKISIPMPLEKSVVEAKILVGDFEKQVPIVALRQTRLEYRGVGSYRVAKGIILSARGHQLIINKQTPINALDAELRRLRSLLKRKQFAAALIRMIYWTTRPFFRKNIWLISDRPEAGGDNGEALFKYLCANNKMPKNTRAYFVISKNSQDYKALKRKGRVINRRGILFTLLFLNSQKVISSHADSFVLNPFGDNDENLLDLYRYEFIFLQHGITKDDISEWLNRYKKNIKLFVTAATQEYESILSGNYGYSKDVVKLTGFPRYDYLESSPKNKVIIAPTWRKGLTGETDKLTGKNRYNLHFRTSDYFLFYQKLISDPRLKTALKDNNMTCEFYLHPSLEAQIDDFQTKGTLVAMKKMPYNYNEAFREGNVLVTDYSSVAFDFAYLKKPILYTHFDSDTFFSSHIYTKGYFSYVNNGFGEVAQTYEETVTKLIDILNQECRMPKKYQERVDKFFAHTDSNNCERVYQQIMEMTD
jgi:CDP-glycerol glycerophosphotransferase (TagB/SpsB family)/glycosyltransferase involved in cell wall biosynthesis